MELKDLKRTDAEKQEQVKSYEGSPSDVPDYSYGLNIHLDNEMLEKLGLKPSDFDAGVPVKIMATGIIESQSMSQYGGKPRHSMSIQLQKMAIEQEADSVNRLDAMYGG